MYNEKEFLILLLFKRHNLFWQETTCDKAWNFRLSKRHN